MQTQMTTYFFDCPLTKAWCETCAQLEDARDIKDFVLKVTGTSIVSDRTAIVRELLPESERNHAAKYLKTLERLRETFILLPDHVEFCFDSLPKTPKNTILKNLMLAYFNSELHQDWVTAAWRLIARLKSAEHFGIETAVFVRSLEPSLILGEIATAFRYSACDVRLVEAADIAMGGAEMPSSDVGNVTWMEGSLTSRIAGLAEAIRTALGSGVSKVFIPFCGNWETRQTLEVAIASVGARTKTIETKNTEEDPFGALTHAPFPLLRRLQLQRIFIEGNGRFDPSQWIAFWDKAFSDKQITEDEHRHLLCPPNSGRLAVTSANVFLGPFIIPHEQPQAKTFAFLSDEPFSTFENSLFLTDDECHTLVRQGFPLPNYHDYKTRILSQCHLAKTVYAPPGVCDTARSKPTSDFRLNPKAHSESPVIFPPRPLSATALENYARCPSIYFFQNALRLREPQSLSDRSYSLLLGQAVHLTLERLFSKGQPLDNLNATFEHVLKEKYPMLSRSHPMIVCLMSGFKTIASHIPPLEHQLREMFGLVQSIHFERSFEINVGSLSMRGKIDRIDCTTNGKWLLIDYKTGSVDFSPQHIASGTHFQALVYLLAAEHETIGFLFYDLKNGELRRGLLREEHLSTQAKKSVTRGHALKSDRWEALIAAGKEHIQRIGELILSGRFEPTPSASDCARCALPTHCRTAYDHH